MFEGLYNSASGMVTQGKIQEVISGNIAKAVIPGYKRIVPVVKSFDRELDISLKESRLLNDQVGGADVSRYHTVFEAGNMKATENPLDLAIEGEGFFTININDNEYYTRNGRFSINNEGQLVTPEGYLVMGDGGPIEIIDGNETNPAVTRRINISSTGDISIQVAGQNNERKVGKLKIVMFEDISKLQSLGQSVFTAGRGSDPQIMDRPRIAQGYVEESNVNILDEMVSMIANMRIYETNQRALSNMSNAYNRSINEIGRVS
ncbi:MAG: flagellar hook-basal body protein [Candidatus Auribacterota bacterium]|jgi:flagellar basal-body rod protein FlgG|nr:flagellar hook-basal body protein [Candidatus Auribacterota bacterium]